MKIKKGDQVLITAGKDKGKKGRVEEVFPKKGTLIVPGLNLYKKHLKKRDEKASGGIIDFPRPIPVGNIALICPKCKKPTRIGFIKSGNEKMRVCRKCKESL